MKVVAVIPVFGRLPLLKYTIQRLYEKNKVDLVICIGQTPTEEKLCKRMDAVFFRHPNTPLGMKWNYGFRKARDYQADAALFVGSSDWLSDNWLEVLAPRLKDCALVGTPDFHLLDISKRTGTFRACYWAGYQDQRKGEPIGIGRLISAEVLEKIGWSPFEDRKHNSMDYQMMKKVMGVGGKVSNYVGKEIKSLSLSCDQWDNKHKFEEHWNNRLPSEKLNAAEIVREFPEALQIFPELRNIKYS
jgi:hypothetical protein